MHYVQNELFPPFPREDWRHHQEPIEAAVRRVMESGRYILDAEGIAFEREWGAYLRARHVVGLASGTDAIGMMLRSLRIGRGDRVVIPSMAPGPVASGVARAGADILLSDCDPATFTMCPKSLDAVLKTQAARNVKAALVVHLFGHVADWEGLRKVAQAHGIELLEDAAQAHGAEWHGRKAGTLGKAAAFSFYPTK
ncbi:MAG: eryC, partial [Verrucomicrobiaceae bacterium]|nr:eryC [Verrucomicrobiaceae bacterium]